MRTVVLGEPPVEVQALIEKRRALGQDVFDEIWDGEYHVVPAPNGPHSVLGAELLAAIRPYARRGGLVCSQGFNLGAGPQNYRVPDLGVHRSALQGVWFATAAVVVEILSPDDETWAKFDFYASHGVDEICVADPQERTLQWFARRGDGYESVEQSQVLVVAVSELAAQVEWPP